MSEKQWRNKMTDEQFSKALGKLRAQAEEKCAAAMKAGDAETFRRWDSVSVYLRSADPSGWLFAKKDLAELAKLDQPLQRGKGKTGAKRV